jgi:hypothetical protein
MTARLFAATLSRGAVAAIALALAAASPSRAAAPTTAPASALAPTATADSAMKDLPMSAAERATYAGTYSATSPEGNKMTLVIAEQNGTLVGTMNGQDSSRLRSQGNGVLRPESYPNIALTFSVQGDHATKLTMRQEDRVMEMPRVP